MLALARIISLYVTLNVITGFGSEMLFKLIMDGSPKRLFVSGELELLNSLLSKSPGNISAALLGPPFSSANIPSACSRPTP